MTHEDEEVQHDISKLDERVHQISLSWRGTKNEMGILKKGVEAKMDSLKNGMEEKIEGLKEDMKGLKDFLLKLLQ